MQVAFTLKVIDRLKMFVPLMKWVFKKVLHIKPIKTHTQDIRAWQVATQIRVLLCILYRIKKKSCKVVIFSQKV